MPDIGAGASKYTVGSIMNRLYLQVLTPPGDQFIQVRLGVDIDAVTDTIILGGFSIPEDELLLRQGSLLELDQELVRVVSYNPTAGNVTVTRGAYGTVPSIHLTPLLMVLDPPYSRATVFEAVADNIITLYPRLFTVNAEYLSTVSAGIFPIADDLAVQTISAWGDGWSGSTDIHAEIVDFHQLAGGRAIIANQITAGSMWFRYRRRMGKAKAETDELTALGMDERWANIVLTGAAADLLVGRDLTASQTEWVKSVLEAETIRVGTRMSIGGGLRQYRNNLLNEAAKEMRAEYKPKVRMRDPMKSIV